MRHQTLLLASSQVYVATLKSLKYPPSPAPHSLTVEILVYLPSWLITLQHRGGGNPPPLKEGYQAISYKL